MTRRAEVITRAQQRGKVPADVDKHEVRLRWTDCIGSNPLRIYCVEK